MQDTKKEQHFVRRVVNALTFSLLVASAGCSDPIGHMRTVADEMCACDSLECTTETAKDLEFLSVKYSQTQSEDEIGKSVYEEHLRAIDCEARVQDNQRKKAIQQAIAQPHLKVAPNNRLARNR